MEVEARQPVALGTANDVQTMEKVREGIGQWLLTAAYLLQADVAMVEPRTPLGELTLRCVEWISRPRHRPPTPLD